MARRHFVTIYLSIFEAELVVLPEPVGDGEGGHNGDEDEDDGGDRPAPHGRRFLQFQKRDLEKLL